jgi:PhzF family phenazine biosynthesis protein
MFARMSRYSPAARGIPGRPTLSSKVSLATRRRQRASQEASPSRPGRGTAATSTSARSGAALPRTQRSNNRLPKPPGQTRAAGNDHLILAVRDRARLAALDYHYPALDKLMAGQGWTTVHLVWAKSPTVFHARDPFPPGGVVEDPATGAAAAAFGGYLRALALVDVPARVTILQGADMRRPSRLLVDLAARDERVQVTGTANPIPPRGRVSGIGCDPSVST